MCTNLLAAGPSSFGPNLTPKGEPGINHEGGFAVFVWSEKLYLLVGNNLPLPPFNGHESVSCSVVSDSL